MGLLSGTSNPTPIIASAGIEKNLAHQTNPCLLHACYYISPTKLSLPRNSLINRS